MQSEAKKQQRVGIIFGGKSTEHEISLLSAKNVLQALDKQLFEPVLIGISREGKWYIQQTPDIDTDFRLSVQQSSNPVALLPGGNGQFTDSSVGAIDIVFPVLHGTYGEDGTIQGLLEMAGIPYVGPGVLSSAACMDKDITKRLLRDAGVPVGTFKTFYKARAEHIDPTALLEELGVPVFVKPASLGSSVGVSRAQTDDELQTAINKAFAYDHKILVEEALAGDEIECSVLGNDIPKTSAIGRITPRKGGFYSYEAKYLDEDGAKLEIPASIPNDLAEKARLVAQQAYAALDCTGMARVDMFATKDNEIVVNEINTIPGFTSISMYPKLWETSGLPYTELITNLLRLAVERYDTRQAIKTSYKS